MVGRLRGAASLLVLALCAGLCRRASADIVIDELERDPRRIVLVARPFGFQGQGVLNLKISNWDAHVSDNIGQDWNRSKVGFFITVAEAEAALLQDLSSPGSCPLDNSDSVQVLFTFEQLDQAQENGKLVYKPKQPYTVPPEDGGLYSLFFANCMQPHVVVTMTIYSEMYNLLPGGGKDYLSAGDAPLPVLFTVMAVFFFVAALAWAWVLYTNRATAHKVHYLMLALVFFKALSTMSQAGMKHMQRTTGNSEGWNIAYYVFSLFRGTLLFTTIFLLGTGWSFLKPFLSDREKKVICAVLPLQVLANVASIVLDEEGPAQWGWFTARDIFHLLDIICCCAILFPIVWSIKQLRESAHTDGKAARNLHKLTLFRQFYVMVVSYIYFTRIVVYLLKSTTPYQLTWLADAAEQVATLAFYCFTGFKFRPVGNNPYFHLEMDELDESEQELVRREVAENVRDAAK